MKVLITAPSLDETENVSGISSVVKQIIENADTEFFHFLAGKKDGKTFSIIWMVNQILLLPRFLSNLKSTNPDIIHINTALTPLSIARDSALVVAAHCLNYPVLLHLHGGKFMTNGFARGIFRNLTGAMLKRASVVLVLSEFEKRFVENLQSSVDVRILSNAVPFDDSTEPERRWTNERSMIFLGRLHEGKGLNEIAKTCRILKNEGFQFQFSCYGAGEMKDLFVKEMTEILGDKFFYGGVVSGAKKWKVLAEGDIFLLPSHYEGLPMSLIEAMAAGCVPVVSNVGSISEVVEDNVNGFLIEPGNISQIVEKLKHLLSASVDWNVLVNQAKKTIHERHNLSEYIVELESIYHKIYSSNRL